MVKLFNDVKKSKGFSVLAISFLKFSTGCKRAKFIQMDVMFFCFFLKNHKNRPPAGAFTPNPIASSGRGSLSRPPPLKCNHS